MGLSDDQRAMLRLLAQRGEQGYEDIAALKGLSVGEVRAQVAEALAQLDEEGALAATPPATTPEPEAPKETPEPAAPKAEPAAPKPPPEAAPAASKAKRSRSPRRSASKLSAPSGSGLRAAIAAGIAVVALIAIVLIVSGGDDESTAGSTATTAESTTGTSETANNPASNPNGVTKAVLKPVGGGVAKGVAIFGKVAQGKKESLALEVAIEGLEPSANGTSYTIWLSQSPQRMLPLVSTPVDKTGKIAGQFEVPVEVLAYLANETFKDLVVTKTTNATLEASLKEATEEKKAPAYSGDEVLRGTITGPVVGAANR